ncbi:hypothetical protein AK830_g9085 [Neonectria ditissima]|uniref:Uncharacterized protein n=1 Tax=Neonectria ditissima TaxID=78410 RepID=A0A0P7ASI6_9HYPO|nr:hypothetical protein AK830_g9085 [Neonectria ditissima]
MNGPNAGPQRQAYQQTMNQWRQQALADRSQYEERVKAQINRTFQEYSPPFYASIIGFNRERNLLVVTSRVSGFAATLGRDLEDSETKAIAEHTLSNIHTNAELKWATLALAGYMTYRGRRTWQFPFYKPKLGGRFNPNEATSIFSSRKITGTYPRLTWHTLRFTAYAAVTMLMVEPVFRTVNFIRSETFMAADPRLEQFIKEASSKVEQVMSEGPARPGQPQRGQRKQSGSDGQGNTDDNTDDVDEYGNHTAKPKPLAPFTSRLPWNGADRDSSSQNQPSGKDWNLLDDDDASPVASSSMNQSSTPTASGGSWDRLRKQTQPRPPQPQQQNPGPETQGGWADAGRSQAQPQSGSQPQSAWGEEEEGSSAKLQAQREFDQMIERERQGNDQSRQWGSR